MVIDHGGARKMPISRQIFAENGIGFNDFGARAKTPHQEKSGDSDSTILSFQMNLRRSIAISTLPAGRRLLNDTKLADHRQLRVVLAERLSCSVDPPICELEQASPTVLNAFRVWHPATDRQ
jgi:hypothetical protein